MTKQSREIIRRRREEHRLRYIELTTFGWSSTMTLIALSYLCDSGWCNFWTFLACGAGAFSIIMTANYDY